MKVKKLMVIVQQFSEKNSLFVNKEVVLYLKTKQVLKLSKHLLIFVVLYPQRREIYMQKYVEIKRDRLTLRGMLHVPDDISHKVPMVIVLHGFCDDRNEINFVHNELSQRMRSIRSKIQRW